MNNQSFFSFKNLTKMYGSGHTKVIAVDNISIDVEEGDIILIIGPSGSGKTTLLTMMGLLLTPDVGSIYFKGKNVTAMNNTEKTTFRLNNIGFVFQSFNLLSALRAWENIYYIKRLTTNQRKVAKEKTFELMGELGIQHIAKHKTSELSGGEKQRTALARALINEPSVILADEPTANLDSKNGEKVAQILSQITCRENKAVIIVSHDERLEKVAKRIITIEDGKIKDERPGQHIQTCPNHY
ncbi:MAG: ABC transporter ATP-binding protein [bacterium]|nr:ABC transporter ATP-binding protein [bacterium]